VAAVGTNFHAFQTAFRYAQWLGGALLRKMRCSTLLQLAYLGTWFVKATSEKMPPFALAASLTTQSKQQNRKKAAWNRNKQAHGHPAHIRASIY